MRAVGWRRGSCSAAGTRRQAFQDRPLYVVAGRCLALPFNLSPNLKYFKNYFNVYLLGKANLFQSISIYSNLFHRYRPLIKFLPTHSSVALQG